MASVGLIERVWKGKEIKNDHNFFTHVNKDSKFFLEFEMVLANELFYLACNSPCVILFYSKHEGKKCK